MKLVTFVVAGALVTSLSAVAAAANLEVGPGKTYDKPCAAIGAAKAGDVVLVDAAGSYEGDHCEWATDNLTIRGVNGRAKIDAGGDPANSSGGKGIFVVSAPNATIESFELAGAVVADQNGAGIRHQGTNLTVRDCYFHDNQDGILGSPSVVSTGEVLIDRSEFANNGAGDGQSHNMYLNHYAKITLQYSYSHGAKVGHLVKLRGVENHVLYNRLTDEVGTTASYELSFPSAGTTFVIGNVIEQSDATGSSAIIDYASEPATLNPDLHLYVVNNTIVNDRTAGATFIADHDATTPAVIMNNVFVGTGTVTSQANAVLTTNFSGGDPKLGGQASYDYHLLAGSPCVDMGTDPGMGSGQPLTPTSEYVHPRSGVARASVGKIDIGAYELGNPGGALDGGVPPGGDGGSIPGSDGGASVDGSSGGSSGSSGNGSSGSSGGGTGKGDDAGSGASQPGTSGCSVNAGGPVGGGVAPFAVLSLAALGLRRRKVKASS